MSNNQLRYVILTGLFAIPFVPLIVSSSLFFPFITGKAFVFRILVELIFAAYLVLALRDADYRPKFSWLLVGLLAFLVIIGLADLLAENPFKAFWSNFERMEGYIALLHFGAYFLVLSATIKGQEIWNKLLATSVFGSVIMSIYSVLQITGKVAINQGGVRVDGTLGNASYLGIYMVFHIFFAGLLFFRSNKKWQKVLLILIAIINTLVLYYTATRGAILGFLGGILITFLFLLFKSVKGDQIRKVALVGLVAVVIFVGSFLIIKNTSFVQKSPVLSRFASLSFAEVKTQGRYFVWPMAVKGFLERPILGWGQEGFNFVFNKYYDPRMYNQEPWFDRAHNTYLDWLVAGGVLGLLSYLSLIFFVFYYIFKASDQFLKKEDKAVLLGALSAYLFHNLFVFDQISSYILFFTVLAYVQSHTQAPNLAWWDKLVLKLKKLVEREGWQPIFESIVLIGLVLVLYFANFVPWRENRNLLNVLFLNNQGQIGNVTDYTKPLNSSALAFPESLEHISQTSFSLLTNQQVPAEFKKQIFDALDQAFIKQLKRAPNDARYRLFYGIFLSRFGWYGRAVEQLKIGRELSPKKQTLAFELISNLILDGKNTEAVTVAKEVYEESPSFEEAKFIYGLTLLSAGNQVESQKIFADIPKSKLIFDDRYLSVLFSLKRFSEVIELVKQRVELDPTNLQHRITLTAAYLQANRRAEAVQTLQELIRIEPSFKEKGEYYIKEIQAGRNP
jgi:O-antigen ligase/protein involved in temperature-dependent protein secretion